MPPPWQPNPLKKPPAGPRRATAPRAVAAATVANAAMATATTAIAVANAATIAPKARPTRRHKLPQPADVALPALMPRLNLPMPPERLTRATPTPRPRPTKPPHPAEADAAAAAVDAIVARKGKPTQLKSIAASPLPPPSSPRKPLQPPIPLRPTPTWQTAI